MNEANQNKQDENQKQALIGARVKLRIVEMQLSGDYPVLDWDYLAKKLNRHQTAITHALQDKSPTLLARINRHLDYLVAQRDKKRAKKAA